MSTLQDTPTLIPRSAVAALGGVLLVSLVAVAWARYTGWNPREPDAPTVTERTLAFADAPGGAIAVTDAASGQPLGLLQGEQGFLRGVLRSFMRERKRQSLPLEAPLRLLARADGRLTLHDPSTGQRVDLESFGRDNVAVFTPWISQRGQP
jgi:putative photosynthetic complex assembly protein